MAIISHTHSQQLTEFLTYSTAFSIAHHVSHTQQLFELHTISLMDILKQKQDILIITGFTCRLNIYKQKSNILVKIEKKKSFKVLPYSKSHILSLLMAI